jgi:MGT family glycosyltransferase
MSTFWFTSAPLYSHTDWGGMMATARVLRDRGHTVIWVSEAALADAIRANGLEFQAIPHTGWLWPPPPADRSALAPAQSLGLRYRRALDTWLSEDLVARGVAAIIALAEAIGRPQLIVSDPFLAAAALGAEVLGVPFVVAGWPAQAGLDPSALHAVQRDLGHASQERIRRLCEPYDLRAANFALGPAPSITSPLLHINYFTADWFASEGASLLPQNRFVGGTPLPGTAASPDWLAAIPQDAGLAVITLGTNFTSDTGFFIHAARAAAAANMIPILCMGWSPLSPETKAQLKAGLPGGSYMVPFVPFTQILPRARLFIHHGGMGTTHAAVVHGVPQIVVPHAADQRVQARRVAAAKVGLHLTTVDVAQGRLPEAVTALLAADWVQENARALQERMAQAGGPAAAASLIEAQVAAVG